MKHFSSKHFHQKKITQKNSKDLFLYKKKFKRKNNFYQKNFKEIFFDRKKICLKKLNIIIIEKKIHKIEILLKHFQIQNSSQTNFQSL